MLHRHLRSKAASRGACMPGTRRQGYAKTVRTADRELSVVDVGDGPPLRLVHGFPLGHAMWEAQIDALREHYRVLAPDSPVEEVRESRTTTGS